MHADIDTWETNEDVDPWESLFPDNGNLSLLLGILALRNRDAYRVHYKPAGNSYSTNSVDPQLFLLLEYLIPVHPIPLAGIAEKMDIDTCTWTLNRLESRLAELQDKGLVEKTKSGYSLSDIARQAEFTTY